MAAEKMDVMRTWLAGAAALLVLGLMAPPAMAQTNCTPDGYSRDAPYCFNAPGTRAPSYTETEPLFATNSDAHTTPLQSCPDGGTFGRTLWMAVHPHAAGSFALVVIGLDARMVIEDVATGQRICSDDSFDEGDTRILYGLALLFVVASYGRQRRLNERV
jgi:hypothetical protein